MKKIALCGLLLISSTYAETGTPFIQTATTNPTTLEIAKQHLIHAWLVSKEKTLYGGCWVWNHLPQTPESIRSTYKKTQVWLAFHAALGSQWVKEKSPESLKNWFSIVTDSCKPALHSTKQIILNWIEILKQGCQ